MQDRSTRENKNGSAPNDADLADGLRKRMAWAGRQVLGEPPDEEHGGHFVFKGAHRANQQADYNVLIQTEDHEGTVLREVSEASAIESGGYRSPMLLAQMLVVMLAIQAGYFLFCLMAHFAIVAQGLVSTRTWGPLELLLFPLTAAAFIAWIHRLYGNLNRFCEAGMTRTPFAAAALVAVPIVNFVTTPIVLREVWLATNPRIDERVDDSWRKSKGDTVIPAWWLTFVLAIVLRLSATLMPGIADNPLITVACFTAFSVSAVLGIASIWRISARQDDRQLLMRAGLQEE
jgi:hypothetical protein